MTDTPLPGETWVHYNGIPYLIVAVTNMAHETPTHPPDVVYMNHSGWWSRPLSDWHRSFTQKQD